MTNDHKSEQCASEQSASKEWYWRRYLESHHLFVYFAEKGMLKNKRALKLFIHNFFFY